MRQDDSANPQLPCSFRSPWRWITLALSTMLLLTGLAVASEWGGDVVILLIGLAVILCSGWWIYTAWRSGVFVNEDGVVERGIFGTSTRMGWTDVAEIEIGSGPSLLPSRTVVLVGKDGKEDVALNSLSWYSFRPSRVPRRVAEFQQVASLFLRTG